MSKHKLGTYANVGTILRSIIRKFKALNPFSRHLHLFLCRAVLKVVRKLIWIKAWKSLHDDFLTKITKNWITASCFRFFDPSHFYFTDLRLSTIRQRIILLFFFAFPSQTAKNLQRRKTQRLSRKVENSVIRRSHGIVVEQRSSLSWKLDFTAR